MGAGGFGGNAISTSRSTQFARPPDIDAQPVQERQAEHELHECDRDERCDALARSDFR